MDFTEARDSGISWVICKSARRSRQITTPAPHHSVFTGQMPFLPPNNTLATLQSIKIGSDNVKGYEGNCGPDGKK